MYELIWIVGQDSLYLCRLVSSAGAYSRQLHPWYRGSCRLCVCSIIENWFIV